MSGLVGNPLFFSTSSAQYQIERSLRFNSADSAYLSRTPASAGNRKTWTWAGWVKRSAIGTQEGLFSAGTSLTNDANFGFTGGIIECFNRQSSTLNMRLQTTSVFRDFSAWYHIVFVWNTTSATASDRVQIWVNGSRITAFTLATYPNQDTDSIINNNVITYIGTQTLDNYFNGYLADIHFIDGQALTPTSFGEFDVNNVWQPKAYTGSYGTNGFKLNFSNNSAATAAALGADSSGNGNNWTPTNFSVSQGVTSVSQAYSTTVLGSSGTANLTSLPNGGNTAIFSNIFDGSASTTYYTGSTSTFNVRVNLVSPITYASRTVSVFHATLNSIEFITTAGNVTATTGGSSTGEFTYTNLLPAGGSITAIRFFTNAGNTNDQVSYIKIDGQILNLFPSSADYDSLVDTPTNYGTDTGVGGEVRGNYCTWNPVDNGGLSIANGNLDLSRAASDVGVRGTFAMRSGKWYWECTATDIVAGGGSSNKRGHVGLTLSTSAVVYPGDGPLSWGYVSHNGNKYTNSVATAYGASWVTGDVIGVAFDADAGSLTFYKNGVSQGVAFSGLSAGDYLPAVGLAVSGAAVTANFGQRPFAFPVSGFKALCSANLPTPTIANPATAMDVKLYTGNGSTQTISGLGFSPDFAWFKGRSAAENHVLSDTVRGADRQLFSNLTNAEQTNSTYVTSFTSDGFNLGSNTGTGGNNINGTTYVAWAWDAGSSTVTNTSGSISSQVRANASAGFSVVTYTGTGANATVGHGLGVAPGLVIVKRRDANSNWQVRHTSIAAANSIQLNLTNRAAAATTVWNSTAPTSTVFSIGTDATVNASGGTYVAYCFAPVAGYSAFGSYTGNGSTDGPFVFLGFRPAVVLLKNSTTEDFDAFWIIVDDKREGYNVDNDPLYADRANAEGTSDLIDITSNGFKLRTATSNVINTNAATTIYAAWASSPFQYARAR